MAPGAVAGAVGKIANQPKTLRSKSAIFDALTEYAKDVGNRYVTDAVLDKLVGDSDIGRIVSAWRKALRFGK